MNNYNSNKILKVQKIGFQWEMEDPFLFCAHHKDQFPKGNSNQEITESLSGRNIGSDFSGKDGYSMYHGEKVPGFPVHPHRGFETVTVVLEGLIDHFDSKGSKGRYGNGDVQWLTTGSGCQHSEMFPLVNQEKDNPCELFQIWLNLPAKDKFTNPEYKMLWSEDIPIVVKENAEGKKTFVRVISGSFDGMESLSPCPGSWAYPKENKVGIFLIHMEPGATIKFPVISDSAIRNLYFYQGEDVVEIDGEKVSPSNRVKLSGNEEVFIQNKETDSYLLMLEAEPIKEPVAQYGPFVMNTEIEIQKAYEDYHSTHFGGWPWNRIDPVNEIDRGRFAQHADGSVEEK